MSDNSRLNKTALLLLSQLPRFSKEDLFGLIEVFKEPSAIIDGRNKRDVRHYSESASFALAALKHLRKSFNAEQELERCEKEGIHIISILDEAYPENLKQIFHPPLALYAKGRNASFHEASVAIVGSRRSSIYGEGVASDFASKLSAWGVTVVSGLARGIDGSAHRGALRVKGRTVAVLGSGIDVV